MRVSVIGAGVVGLATTRALRDLGAEVSCFESTGPMSQRSSGSSRIFRHAHADPALVELAIEAGLLYRQWASEAGRPLVGTSGTVVHGPDVADWAEVMAPAGAEVSLVDVKSVVPPLPVASLAGLALLDHSGGVINAAAVGEFLVRAAGPNLIQRTVRQVEPISNSIRIHHGDCVTECDACVIVAGAHTGTLAAQVGLAVPSTFGHHVRFTFPMEDTSVQPPCLIDRSESWRRGFTSYQHLTAPGRWAVGAHLFGELGAAGEDRDSFTRRSRRFTEQYVRDNLPGVGVEPVEELYCDVLDGWGDGFVIQRSGAVLTVHGENLFKLAPALGRILAGAVMDGSTPRSWEPVAADATR